ncbi:MAG TPA: MmgE/PrpD family protein [Bordetella sp.]
MEKQATQGLTRHLVEQGLRRSLPGLPDDVRRVGLDCLIDWLGCSFAALDEPAGRIVAEVAREEGGHAQATLLGRRWRGSLQQAALVNGTTSHALDYDDVNLSVPGHMSAAIFPALVALAEYRDVRVADLLVAFAAGYEFACSMGKLVEPAHYANGFHATATIGCLAAAMACARLLALPVEQACHAVGVAATQAAGLKVMFGSMAKPLHAGLASQSGLRAVLLAGKGFTSRMDALECPQGFVQVHGADFHADQALSAPRGGFHLLNNLFKFHAACYSTHSTIEAVVALRREHALAAQSVARIDVVAGEGCSICNLQQPGTALEAKFSLRATAAFAMLGIDTSDLGTWGRVSDPEVRALMERVRVELVPEMGLSEATVAIVQDDGRRLVKSHDCGTPMADKAEQSKRVAAKFRAIAAPALGSGGVGQVLDILGGRSLDGRVAELMSCCRG